MPDNIPQTMQALVLHDYQENYREVLHAEECPVPQPGEGEVLVKMSAAPVNPSDLMFMQGQYGFRKETPIVPGFEGAGTVVAAGDGLLPSVWNGRRVACVATTDKNGSWAQYMVTNATSCLPVGGEVNDEQAATRFVDPLTAVALLERARELGARAVVSTAAASQVGRMVLRLANSRAVPAIHIVRRQEQVEMLREMGGRYVLNSSDDDFDAQLHDLTRELKATVLFDAVAGELTGRVLHQMPSGSTAIVYGALAMAAIQMHPADLIFKNKRMEGFWLSAPQKSLNPLSLARLLAAGRGVLGGDATTRTDIRGTYSLADAPDAIAAYEGEMSAGKVLIKPWA